MAYDRALARRNITTTIERTQAALAAAKTADPKTAIFPGAAVSHARHLAEAREALAALNDGEKPEGWA